MRLRLIFALFTGLVTHSWADPVHQAMPEQQNFRTELAQTLNHTQPLTFESWVKNGEHSLCRFGDLCAYFQNNASNAYLYRTPEGSIPNYSLWSLEQSVEACLQMQSRKDGNPLNEAAQFKAFHEGLRLQANHFARLQSSLATHREEKTYLALQKAMFDSIADHSNPMPKNLNDLKDPLKQEALLRQQLAWYQKRAGKLLSAESQAAYIQFALSSRGFLDPKPKLNSPWQRMNPDPFLNTDLLVSTETAGGNQRLQANRKQYEQRLQMSANIFTQTRSEILQLLEQRRTSSNGSQIDALKERIATIRFNVIPIEPALSGPCAGPNAFYSPEQHAMNLCPQILEIPASALKSIVAHELGHAIDPCSMAFEFSQLKLSGRPHAETQASTYTPKLSTPPPTFFYSVDRSERHDFADYSPGQNASVAKTIPGLHRNEYPLLSVVSCLSSAQSVGARTANPNALLQPLRQRVFNQLKEGATLQNSQSLGADLRSAEIIQQGFNDKYACSDLPGPRSQMQEAFADWVATKILSQDITQAKSPTDQRRIAFESVSFSLATGCGLQSGSLYARAEELASKLPECAQTPRFQDALQAAQRAESILMDSHPSDYLRVERIFLASPALQSALSCTPPKGLVQCD